MILNPFNDLHINLLNNMRRPLSNYHPWLYHIRVIQKRLYRYIQWYLSQRKYSKTIELNDKLPYRHKKHTSKLIRKLGNTDIQLQYNKITNLNIVVNLLDGILIKPGEHFSFCKLVGKSTKKRGFVEGIELSFGQARKGIGGGICQISNLIHWLALHSELKVVEKSNHSFDPFPDEGRVLPFGSGAAIFYNYIDLVLYNPTQQTFQICLCVGKHQLEGELRSNQERKYSYHIYELNHAFKKKGDITIRQNEIWRDRFTKNNIKGAPQRLSTEQLYTNSVIVKYHVDIPN